MVGASAFCIGVFGLPGLISGWLVQFDPNIWWIDLRFMPRLLARMIELAGCGSLIGFAIQSQAIWRRRFILLLGVSLLAVVSLENIFAFYKVTLFPD